MKNFPFNLLLIPPFILCLLFLLCGCGKPAEPEARILFIGLDGIELDVLKPLLDNGDCPNLAGLIDRGVFGYLQTFQPTFSPVVWTSIATGKDPDQHKIRDFLEPNSGVPYTSNARDAKALWNIVSDYGLECNVTGYWVTWPAEKINGHMVSQVTSRQQYSEIWKGMLYADIEDSTWPPEFLDEVWPVVEPFQSREFLDKEVLPAVFGDIVGLNPSERVIKLIDDSIWSLAGDFLYNEAGKYLLEHYPADLDIVYLGGTDVIPHRFWRFREPDLYSYMDEPRQKKYIPIFKDAIDNYYKVADRLVGELLGLVPKNTRVIICSDHGMHADFLDGKDNGRPTLLSAHHMDAPPGLIIAAGDGIRKGRGLAAMLEDSELDSVGTVFDVAPTILYLLDIPVGGDMKLGRVMKNLVSQDLLNVREVEYIESHDVDFRMATPPKASRENDRAFTKRMLELGYIGRSESAEYKMGPRK